MSSWCKTSSTPLVVAALAAACASRPPAAPAPRASSDDHAAPAATVHHCVLESWSHEELGRATGRGANATEASEDAARQLCADVEAECPSDELLVVYTSLGGARPSFPDGANYRLLRRTYATHAGSSERSRALACVAAERAFEASEGPRARALAGVQGLRWSGQSSNGTASELVDELRRSHLEVIGEPPFECRLEANATPVIWGAERPGRAGEACLDSAPAGVSGPRRTSIVRCGPGGECHTRCFILGSASTVRVKGLSDQDQRAACVAAAERICPDAECFVEVTSIEGLPMQSFGHRTGWDRRGAPRGRHGRR